MLVVVALREHEDEREEGGGPDLRDEAPRTEQ